MVHFQRVGCTTLVHIRAVEAMVTSMTMITIMVRMEIGKITGMVMEEIRTPVTEMMTDMPGGTHMVETVIGMVEMVIGMVGMLMITGEIEEMTIISMVLGTETLTETKGDPLMKMTDIRLGIFCFNCSLVSWNKLRLIQRSACAWEYIFFPDRPNSLTTNKNFLVQKTRPMCCMHFFVYVGFMNLLLLPFFTEEKYPSALFIKLPACLQHIGMFKLFFSVAIFNLFRANCFILPVFSPTVVYR